MFKTLSGIGRGGIIGRSHSLIFAIENRVVNKNINKSFNRTPYSSSSRLLCSFCGEPILHLRTNNVSSVVGNFVNNTSSVVHLSTSSSSSSFGNRRNKQADEEEGLTEEERKVLEELKREEALLRERENKKIQEEEEKKLKDSVSETYVPFKDQQRIIQDVIDEIWNPLPEQEESVEYKPPPEFLLRGKTGVFDLSELLDLLRGENCNEIVSISIPKEIDYADYMVIVTCRNPRHLVAVATYVRKRFKMKELKKTDVLPYIVSEKGHQGWIALDLGNIVLHLFLQRQRDHYDLEMLWTVGPMFDDLSNTEDPEIIQLLNAIK